MIIQFEHEKDTPFTSSTNSADGSACEAMPGAAEATSQRDKSYYLDLIRRQSQQMREMGFLRSLGADEIAQIEVSLEKLPFDLLKAIARGAGNLLRGN
jgi:hypothetical protein